MQRHKVWLLGLALCLTLAASAGFAEGAPPSLYQPKIAAQVPPMRVEAIDGVRFRDIETKAVYRLTGVDACAPGQTATLGRQPWPCGTLAIAWLVNATLNKWIACVTIRDEGDEHVARCATAGYPDLAAAMLRAGMAVLTPAAPSEPATSAYASAEQDARKAYRGLWSSSFQMPWEWRAQQAERSHTAAAAEARP